MSGTGARHPEAQQATGVRGLKGPSSRGRRPCMRGRGTWRTSASPLRHVRWEPTTRAAKSSPPSRGVRTVGQGPGGGRPGSRSFARGVLVHGAAAPGGGEVIRHGDFGPTASSGGRPAGGQRSTETSPARHCPWTTSPTRWKEAVRQLPDETAVDCEVIVSEAGLLSSERLQQGMHHRGAGAAPRLSSSRRIRSRSTVLTNCARARKKPLGTSMSSWSSRRIAASSRASTSSASRSSSIPICWTASGRPGRCADAVQTGASHPGRRRCVNFRPTSWDRTRM